MNVSSAGRLSQIDFLRAIAVFLVIGNHMAVCPPEVSGFFNLVTGIWNQGGWVGVDLFFVLSGFLISGLLFREYKKYDRLNIKKFLVRRGFKIYPPFWFLIFTTLAIVLLSHEKPYRLGFLDEMLFIQNYEPSIWNHTWSLAVEEHFYIFLSLLFFVLLVVKKEKSGNPFTAIPWFFAAVAVVCLAFRLITAVYVPFEYGVHICQTHLRIDSLFFGVFLAYFWHFGNLSENKFLIKYKFFIGLTGAGLLLPAFIFEVQTASWIWVAGLTLFYLGSGLLLLVLLKSDTDENAFVKFFAELGKYSYSIYLWNLPIHFWLTKFTNLAAENWFLYTLIYWTGTLVLGVVSAKLIEYPFLRLRDKLMPSQVSSLKTA
ncbi:MAG: acyltransferase [Pyrinomonadaceae bacterium]